MTTAKFGLLDSAKTMPWPSTSAKKRSKFAFTQLSPVYHPAATTASPAPLEIADQPASSVGDVERVLQNVVAMDRVDGGLALPTLAALLGSDRGAMFLDGFRQVVAQIKIAPDTSVVRTIDTEH